MRREVVGFTSTKLENPDDNIGQNPAVPTELEQVIQEDVDHSEANPAGKRKGFHEMFSFGGCCGTVKDF